MGRMLLVITLTLSGLLWMASGVAGEVEWTSEVIEPYAGYSPSLVLAPQGRLAVA